LAQKPASQIGEGKEGDQPRSAGDFPRRRERGSWPEGGERGEGSKREKSCSTDLQQRHGRKKQTEVRVEGEKKRKERRKKKGGEKTDKTKPIEGLAHKEGGKGLPKGR